MGTPLYTAPEVHSGHYSSSVDVYSLAVMIMELLGVEPAETIMERQRNMERAVGVAERELGRRWAQELLPRMWCTSPQRESAAELVRACGEWAAPAVQEPRHGGGSRLTVNIATMSGGRYQVQVASTDSVASIKQQLEAQAGMPASVQRLLFAGRELADESSIASCGMWAEATLHMVPRRPQQAARRAPRSDDSEASSEPPEEGYDSEASSEPPEEARAAVRMDFRCVSEG